MPNLLLVRHGRTTWNDEGRYTGQSDIDLNKEGKEKARELGLLLKDTQINAAYSSDLIRAYDTCKIILKGRDLKITLDPRLREINQGKWEGMFFEEIKEKYKKEIEKRKEDPTKVSAPGGETIKEFQTRTIDAINDIRKAHKEDENILITSHGLSIAMCVVYYNKFPLKEIYNHIPENTKVIKMSLN